MIIKDHQIRRLKRVRAKLSHNQEIPRLSVFRSNQHLWAQIVDDQNGRTLVAFSTKNLKETKGTKTEKAFELGRQLAKLALAQNINQVRFDRGLSRYHGRIKAVAEGARQGGLKL